MEEVGREVIKKRRKQKDLNDLKDECKETCWEWNSPVSLDNTEYLSSGQWGP